MDLSFNSYIRTELCDIMQRMGSDKGNTPNSHNYTTFYHNIFKDKRENKLNVFEMGLGTTNLNIPSNMGINGKPCASLYGWEEYFKNSNVYGGDIDGEICKHSPFLHQCDMTNAFEVDSMFIKIGKTMDIIIDDGLHDPNANKAFLDIAIKYLKKGGIYIIEDIQLPCCDLFDLKEIYNKYNLTKIELLKIPSANYDNFKDNNIIYIIR